MNAAPVDILLVEDSPLDADLIQRTLRKGGIAFTARRVETEAAMRAALEAATPDIILADYHLPAFDGMSALAIARAMAPHVPFIFVSGSLGEERAVEALLRGATDYVAKDRPTRLPSAVERALRERDDEAARAAVEAALQASERRLRLAFQATQDVIWDLDIRAGTVHVSDALRERWGIDPPPQNLQSWLTLVHPEDRERVGASIEEWLASRQERLTLEYRIRRGDGTYGTAVDRSVVVRDAHGAPLRIVGALQDVTESRRLQDQVARASRVDSLGRLAATVAHEFNNLLMGIQPYAETIARRGDARTAELAGKIIAAVRRGRLIVGDIQRMTRVDEPKSEPLELSQWLRGILVELAAIAGAEVRVTVENGRPVWVRCDPAQLQQVVANLVSNARDAISGGGNIVLSARNGGKWGELSVADDGQGMPEDVAAHIFEPLFSTKRTGTGLGLAVSHRIITQNGGTISVETVAGRGTTFRILLPVWKEDGLEAAEPDVERQRSRGLRRVLIVDDDPSVAEGVSMLLEEEGIEARIVYAGSEAEAAAEEMQPDVVLLDVSLADMDGKEVFDRLIRRWPDLPVVFASGHIEEGGLGSRTSRRNVALLRKPFGLTELLDVIEQIT